ncbi:Piso0_005787 [Millerozyma farinosa CBS 7064]|uniref:Piso0_005787 protein n=1 Tax=Pichia sorbitophila (strain ATCC MYA-4447 / BCRC 22081 / CBS 7064 / NBRC 10061 / NRRL Y-12695) TaxID=559304 RepID=G8Y2X6_PICSO|nr:Piso0_005787 [Millerozyma farinosa CBS 7064]
MNAIKKINEINYKELENNISDSASWHADFRDSSYIFIGFLPQELKEDDVIKIFSQYGIPTHINLVKDKETGKSRGFCYLKYEDYRSCILAVDNLNGVQIFNKRIKVDHVHYYLKEGQNEDDFLINYSEAEKEFAKLEDKSSTKDRRMLPPPERDNSDDEFQDPMEKFNKDTSRQESDINSKSVYEDPEDEFRDPMEGFLGKKSSSSKQKKHKEKHRSNPGNEGEQMPSKKQKRDY